jgi:multidrug efflux pump subunit AcrA (membrane-fusion protein)
VIATVSFFRQSTGRQPANRLALVLLGAVLLQGCNQASDADTAALVTVQAAHPEVGEISEHIAADATLSPVAEAAISPKITAPVRTFYVQRGSRVKKGQLLAVLENSDLDAQALDNQGQYRAAQATRPSWTSRKPRRSLICSSKSWTRDENSSPKEPFRVETMTPRQRLWCRHRRHTMSREIISTP